MRGAGTKNRTTKKQAQSLSLKRVRLPSWTFWVPLILLMLMVLSCKETEQRNVTFALASKDGGTAGGPINGKLEVQVFDDVARTPLAGIQVFIGSNDLSATTNSQGIATFENLVGPQDIHVYACLGCVDSPLPLFYQNVSFYQVNASRVAIPMVTRDVSLSSGRLEGKVFNMQKDETAFLGVIDALGGFLLLGPTSSLTQQEIDFTVTSPKDLTFVYARDLDDWAKEAGVQQNFREAAILGKVVNAEKLAQPGVQVTAEYFNGANAGRAYYFNDSGVLDSSLEATTSDGRFLFLKLVPNNDVIVYSASRGIGVGLKFLRLPREGTAVLNLPVVPLSNVLNLNGRVVVFRPDYREEEEKGPLSSENIGVARAFINFSGDTFSESFVGNEGVVTAGHYQVTGRLPNSRYVIFLSAGSGFRATFQEMSFSDRSKTNYPLTVARISTLTNMIIQAQIPDPANTDEDGNIPIRLAFLPNNGEFLGRVTEKTGVLDVNGDPKLQALEGAVVTVTGEAGNEVGKAYAIDISGNILCRFGEGSCATDASGGFFVFDLPAASGLDVYVITARESGGALLDRQTRPVYANSVRLVELIKRGTLSVGPTLTVKGEGNNPVASTFLTLIGGPLQCAALCFTDASGDLAITPFTEGDYLIRMSRVSGGGDYSLRFQASKRRLGFTAFRIGPDDSSYNLTFGTGLGPLGPSGRLPFDIFFEEDPTFFETTGTITLPPGFQESDLKMASMGGVVPQGRVFTGTDTDMLVAQPSSQYRIQSILAEGIESFFLGVRAQNAAGALSFSLTQGLSAIPDVLDVSLPTPPVQITPASGATGMGLTPTFSWVPGTSSPVDLYLVSLESTSGALLWQAWVPGSLQEIVLPPFPEGVTAGLKPLSESVAVVWKVEAIRAQEGVSFHDFNRQELAKKIIDRSLSRSSFTP